MRFVPGAALDPNGVGSYVLFAQLADAGLRCSARPTLFCNTLHLS